MGKLKELYQRIWHERTHECEVCGVEIPSPVVNNFAHWKSKGSRPDLKFNPKNIVIMCSSLNSFGRTGCHEAQHTNAKLWAERSNNFTPPKLNRYGD